MERSGFGNNEEQKEPLRVDEFLRAKLTMYDIENATRKYTEQVRKVIEKDAAWKLRRNFYDFLGKITEKLPETILLDLPEERVTLRTNFGDRTYGNPYGHYYLPHSNEIYRYWGSGPIGFGLDPIEQKYVPESSEFIGVDAVKAEENAGTLVGVWLDPMHEEPSLNTFGDDCLSEVSSLSPWQIGKILDSLERILQKPESKQLLENMRSHVRTFHAEREAKHNA